MQLLIMSWDLYVGALQSLEIRNAPQDQSTNQEVLEPEDSSQSGSETETSSAYQEDQEPTPPEIPSGWMGYIESLIK